MVDEIMHIIGRQNFVRVDPDHPLNWFCDNKERPRILVLNSPGPSRRVFEVNGIAVRSWDTNAGGNSIAFFVRDEKYARMFRSFYFDVLKHSQVVAPEDGPKFVMDRFQHWVDSFRISNDLLATEEIQGLVGELVALKNVFVKKYGLDKAVDSWMNRFRNKQDFIFDDFWYEVKTIIEGKQSIRISSLDQLARTDYGKIVLITLRRTSDKLIDSVNLNMLYRYFTDLIKDTEALKVFEDTLVRAGYEPDSRYDQFSYEVASIRMFDVGDNFPRLTHENIPNNAIIEASYDLSLNSLIEFEVKKWN